MIDGYEKEALVNQKLRYLAGLANAIANTQSLCRSSSLIENFNEVAAEVAELTSRAKDGT